MLHLKYIACIYTYAYQCCSDAVAVTCLQTVVKETGSCDHNKEIGHIHILKVTISKYRT